MQNNRPFSPTHPQRAGGILPPLSKYYYGPAVSPDQSPANADTSSSAPNFPQSAPSLPPRLPPNPAFAPSPSQSSSNHHVPSQQSKFPGPTPNPAYNPSTYGPMPGARFSPINATWNQSSQSIVNADTSTWGVNYNHLNAQHSQSDVKPPLPPRGLSSQSQHHVAPHKTDVQYHQGNGSFEYLRPVAYSPSPSPSIPQDFQSPANESTQHMPTHPEFTRFPPPPPPQKIPLSNIDGLNQRPQAPVKPLHGLSNSFEDHEKPADLETHAAGDNIDQQELSPEAPSFVTTEIQSHNNPTTSLRNGGLNLHDLSHASQQPIWSNRTETHSNPMHGDDGEVLSLTEKAQDVRTTPETSEGDESRAPDVQNAVYAAVNSSQQPQHDDSFYWHSPHSSASMSHDRDQNQDVPNASSLLDATPEPQEQHVSPPPLIKGPTDSPEKTPNLYQSTMGPYSASVLGFGGPSDWEHFGDYDGEEVDDTDLYIRPRSPIKQAVPGNSLELPADPAEVYVQSEERSTVAEDFDGTVFNARQTDHALSCPGKTQTMQDQHECKQGLSTEVNAHGSRQPDEVDQLGDSTPFNAQEEPSTAQQPTTTRNAAKFLPHFPFEQEQTELTVEDSATDQTVVEHHKIPTERSDEITTTASRTPSSPSAMAASEDSTAVEREPTLSNIQSRDELPQPSNKSIDGPFENKEQPQPEDKNPIMDLYENSRENSIKQGSIVSDGSVLSKIKEIDDPYADLDPWGKASLNRYVAMLREEAGASTEAEKLNMFKVFMKKEWKLRAVLYGAADEQEFDPLSPIRSTPIRHASSLAIRRPASKALPALPPDADQRKTEAAPDKSLLPSEGHKSPLAQLMTKKEEETASGSSKEDTSVMVDTSSSRGPDHPDGDISEIYSPGGRPVQAQIKKSHKNITSSDFRANIEVTDNAQSNASEEHASDSKSAYTPFRYSQGYIDDADQPVDRRASFRPYAALKIEPVENRLESDPNPLMESRDRHSMSSAADDRRVQYPTSISRPRSDPKHIPPDSKSQASDLTEQDPPLDLRRFERADFDPLIAVLPQSGQIPNTAVELSDFQHGINAVPDDFSFIRQHVAAWDAEAKKVRIEHEKERQIRQGESEQRIDALFNDDEIGYGDIPELESEFKRAEAVRKTEEDHAEYGTFVEEVFDAVWTRLHFEIDQLRPIYDRYSGLAHGTLAGKDMFEATQGQYALGPTMGALLTLHQKLEIRHQKAFEAVLERDRRLKKIEVAPWYSVGNVSKVKQLEKQFEGAEKKAIAEYCKQRNARANRLMDVLDQNTLRGVGANQDYMEAVMKAVRRIASGRAFASTPANEPGLGMDEVIKAKGVTAVLASSSEQIVQTFHVADMLLNASDYELSVATARLAKADSTTLDRLKEERAKEEAKLMRDLRHRLALIREDSRRTNDEIVKLLCFLGVQGGHAQAGNGPKSPPITDSEHEQRLQKALEDAKRRNAQKAAGNGLP